MIAAYPSPFDSPLEGPVVPLVPPEQKGTGEKKGTGANQGCRSIQVSKCQHSTLSFQENYNKSSNFSKLVHVNSLVRLKEFDLVVCENNKTEAFLFNGTESLIHTSMVVIWKNQ